jgi:hypothetical protein
VGFIVNELEELLQKSDMDLALMEYDLLHGTALLYLWEKVQSYFDLEN